MKIFIVNTIYLVDEQIKRDISFTEYLNKDDKVYFLVNNLTKNSVLRKMPSESIYKERIFVSSFSSNVKDTLDFRIVPFLTELCFKNKDSNIVLVSVNPKLKCLKGYFKEYLGYNIEIVPSIKFYTIANYVGNLLHCNDFEKNASILYNLIRFKQLNLDFLDTKLKTKLSKNSEILNKVNYLYSEFRDIEPIVYIPNKDETYFTKELLQIDSSLDSNTLKRVAHFLKKSESLSDFKEKMNSSNELGLPKDKKEFIVNAIMNRYINE